jgi:UDP-N-acetylglucosamine 1-carboxyvinyltransferase
MELFVIEGGTRLEGTITPAGNKNAALPALIATLLTDEDIVLRNLPDILDIRTILEILEDLGVQVTRLGPNELSIRATAPIRTSPQPDLSRNVRGAFMFAGGCPPRTGDDSPPRR